MLKIPKGFLFYLENPPAYYKVLIGSGPSPNSDLLLLYYFHTLKGLSLQKTLIPIWVLIIIQISV